LDQFFNRFFNFDKMITPTIIKILFWIGVALCVIFGLFQIVSGAISPWGGGRAVLSGILTLVVGPILVRVYCELLIVIFKMHEALQKIADRHKGAESDAADAAGGS